MKTQMTLFLAISLISQLSFAQASSLTLGYNGLKCEANESQPTEIPEDFRKLALNFIKASITPDFITADGEITATFMENGNQCRYVAKILLNGWDDLSSGRVILRESIANSTEAEACTNGKLLIDNILTRPIYLYKEHKKALWIAFTSPEAKELCNSNIGRLVLSFKSPLPLGK